MNIPHSKIQAITIITDVTDSLQATKNPTSTLSRLSGPSPKFTSRYADPSNPAGNGKILSLISGGHLNPPTPSEILSKKRGKSPSRDGGKGKGKDTGPILGLANTLFGTNMHVGKGGDGGGVAKRLIGEDVLYLMIVNMPSQEELEAVGE
jgi:hypothetical protein